MVKLFFQQHRENGTVYGAQWTRDFDVAHGRAERYEDCRVFCGSKYVQSDLGNTLQNVEEDLRNHRAVLFSGTPCQIDALKKFLDKHNCPMDQLLTVDVVCHGTPMPQFWKDYRNWLERREGAALKAFSFRYKPRGWKGYPVLAEFQNGARYENSYRTSHYINVFRKGLLMRPGCFQCKYPGSFPSDITLADFWGVELCVPDMPVKGGVSLVLAHTDTGRRIAEALDATRLSDDRYLQYNHNLLHKTKKPEAYDAFQKDFRENGLEYVLRKYGGHSISGRLRFYGVRFLRDSGLMALGKKVLKRA